MTGPPHVAAGRRSALLAIVALSLAGCAPALLEPFASTDFGYFRSGDVQLYYALDIPRGVARPPVIVLSHGSGKVTTAVNARRARSLVQRGFAVLRFDKRGVGKSGGTYSKAFAHMTVLAGDLVAAVDFVKRDPRIDAGRIGLMGASQAGWVVPEAAVRSPDVAFVVLLAGPTVTGQQANFWDQMADDASLSIDDLEARLAGFAPAGPDLDGRAHLEQLAVPGLWIYGAEDRIIPTRSSVAILEELVTTLGKPFSVVVFPAVGHSIEANYWPDLFAWYDREIGP